MPLVAIGGGWPVSAGVGVAVAQADDGRAPCGESGSRIWQKRGMTRRPGAGGCVRRGYADVQS